MPAHARSSSYQIRTQRVVSTVEENPLDREEEVNTHTSLPQPRQPRRADLLRRRPRRRGVLLGLVQHDRPDLLLAVVEDDRVVAVRLDHVPTRGRAGLARPPQRLGALRARVRRERAHSLRVRLARTTRRPGVRQTRRNK